MLDDVARCYRLAWKKSGYEIYLRLLSPGVRQELLHSVRTHPSPSLRLRLGCRFPCIRASWLRLRVGGDPQHPIPCLLRTKSLRDCFSVEPHTGANSKRGYPTRSSKFEDGDFRDGEQGSDFSRSKGMVGPFESLDRKSVV